MDDEKYLIETPATHPHLSFETRAINCPDGITRLVTLDLQKWRYFDDIIKPDAALLQHKIELCTRAAKRGEPDYHFTFSKALHSSITWEMNYRQAEEQGKLFSFYFNFRADQHHPTSSGAGQTAP
jgi:hypothetical protein